MTAASRLAEWISTADFSGAVSARKAASDAFTDTIGCMFAGWRDPVCHKALTAARQWGDGQSSVVGHRGKLALPAAAFVNGTAAHALDFDDCELVASTHNSAAMVPALLALAEANGNSGAEAIDAYIAGFETIVRIGEAIGYGHYTTGWHATATTGTIGSAAACARLLGLDAQQTTAALTIAASMAGGLKIHFGTDTKPVHAGLAAKSGISAAQLAAAGITADTGALDAPGGFTALFNKQPSPGFTAPLAKLGAPLALDEFGFCTKAYPSCSYTHRPIEAILELRPQTGDPANIAKVSITVPRSFDAVAGKRHPRTPPEARFSIAWCIAVAAINGKVAISDFEDDALTRKDLHTLEERVKVVTYDPIDGASDLTESAPDTLDVQLNDGTKLQSVIGKARGSPTWPMTSDQRQAKFIDCLAGQCGPAQSKHHFGLLQEFGKAGEISKLLSALYLNNE